MKTYIFCAVLSLLMISSASLLAQSSAIIGVKGGAGISNFWFADANKKQPALSFSGGVFFTIKSNNRNLLAFQPELLFAKKGATYALKSNNNKVDFSISNFQFNGLVKKYFEPKNYFNAYIIGGPYAGFRVGQIIKENGIKQEQTEINGVDLGVVLGGGIEYEISRHYFILTDIRYNAGFLQLKDNLDTSGMTNGNLIISVGVGMDF